MAFFCYIMAAAGDINPSTGKAYAINPQSGVWDDNYFAQNFGGASGGSSGSTDFNKMALDAVQPAISSLSASLPEIQTKYQTQQAQQEAEKQPLKDRYDQLLAEIRGRETSQVNDVTRTANREFARRGITADSTFAAEETQGRTQPIRGAAQSDILTTTFDRESKLREIDNTITNLTTEMVTAERDVRNTIAQIQATAGTDAANRALEMYKVQQQEKQNALDRLLTERSLANSEQSTRNSATESQRNFDEQVRQYNIGQANKKTGTTANILNYLKPGNASTPASFVPIIKNFGSSGGGIYDNKGNLTASGKSYYGVK